MLRRLLSHVASEAKAERFNEEALRIKGIPHEQLQAWRKGHPFKRDLAHKFRRETTITVEWIARRLSMGTRGHLARLLKQSHSFRKSDGPMQPDPEI